MYVYIDRKYIHSMELSEKFPVVIKIIQFYCVITTRPFQNILFFFNYNNNKGNIYYRVCENNLHSKN